MNYEKMTKGELIDMLKSLKIQNHQLRERQAEQVQHHVQELEQHVAKRTAQLKAANAELESFVYSVSHDLRAPLRAINGFSEIIARRHRADLNAEGQHYFDNIVEASRQMSKLIDDILHYSRIGCGAVRRQEVALRDILTQVTAQLDGQIAASGATVHLPEKPPTVLGDWTLLDQVFTNLLGNALTYHKPDVPPEVEVRCEPDGSDVIIQVADNGIGIEPEFHEKIFNIFQRLHSQDQYPGTGVGLAIVKKAVN